MTGKKNDPPDDAEGRVMAATGALIEAQLHRNEVVLQQLFAEFRALTAMIPGTLPPATDDDDRFDDVPL